MTLSLLGIGLVSALGCGARAFEEGLEGRARPKLDTQTISLPNGQVSLAVYRAASDELERFVPKRSLRRLDSFSRLALLASHLALEDAGIQIADRARMGLVFGSGWGPLQTTFGFQDGLIADGDRGASPTTFAGSVHNTPAAQVSIQLGIEGPCQTVTCFDQTFPAVLRTAQVWLDEGRADYVLAGAGEEYHPALGYAAARLGAEGEGPVAPFAAGDGCSWRPGEGFVALLLGRSGNPTSPPGPYGLMLALERFGGDRALIQARAQSYDELLLALKGERGELARYEPVLAAPARVHAHAQLYGSMPTGLAFEIAAAALGLKNGRWAPESRLVCLERAGANEYHGVELSHVHQ